MILLHNVGPRINSNYNTREEIAAAAGPISFDGIYRNVYENRDILRDKDAILFVMGNYVGKNNEFDVKANPHLPLEAYCTWDEIFELRDQYGCRVAWHTWSHRNLRTLSDDEVRKELERPEGVEPLLAYPYGDVDERVARITKEMGYVEAWSVFQGDGSALQRKRKYLNW